MVIATVISGDLDIVAQSAPNTRTRFVAVGLDEALDARGAYRKRARRVADLFS
ncbi:hypothetical protein ACVGVM_28355 (plasmid) [Pseudonocardia bannensis]|nr:hypothetical protein [Pseudonocardia bannensis]